MCELDRQKVIIERALEYDGTKETLYWEKDSDFTGNEFDKYHEALFHIVHYEKEHNGKKPSVEEIRAIVFANTEEESEYLKSCGEFTSEMTYEEYVIHVYECLQISELRYKPESALKIIRNNNDVIRRYFEEKRTIVSAMKEIG